MINYDTVETAAREIMARAAIDIPSDYRESVVTMAEQELNPLSGFVLKTMVDNYAAASGDRRPMCADTGLPRYYVKVGNEARVDGGFIALEKALRQATAQATHDIPLRPNRVHPLWRRDHNNNVGINAPEIDWSFEPEVDWIDITTVHKGGLFGPDYRMLFPGDGIDGIKRFLLDSLIAFGKRGLACQPAIVGVGIGVWVDHRWESRFSWTLMLMFVGVVLGCLTAWNWIHEESLRTVSQHSDEEGRE